MRHKIQIFWAMIAIAILGVGLQQAALAHPTELHSEVSEQAASPESHHADEDEAHEHETIEAEDHDMTEAHDHDKGAKTEGHSHWGLSPDSTPFAKSMASIGKYHPLIVHFPIALFMTAAFAQALFLTRRKESYQDTVRFLVWTGLAAVIAAGLLGWAHSGPQQHAEAPIMFSHRWIGTGLLLGALLTTFLVEKIRTQASSVTVFLFNLALFSVAIAVALNGFLGGALAHGGIKHLMPGMG
ncbi:MAG: hypothetical protein COA47_01895 [Robiginitomaculum sp.]|nr:MAG: hypothetical protein COA47_01895 [Robiginitomaculum sp.]